MEARRFARYLRAATDASAPLVRRIGALKGMIQEYDDLTRLGYYRTWTLLLSEALGPERAIGWVGKPKSTAPTLTAEEIDAIAHLLYEQRERFLVELRRFDATRRAEKAAGRRQPARRQVEALYAQAWPSRKDEL